MPVGRGRIRKWLSWNVRGLGSAEKRRSLKEFLKKTKLEVILLQETKLDQNKVRCGEKIAKALNLNFEEVHLTGSAGGLMSLWNAS